MSDTGRQSLTDKVGAAVKPDSQKTTGEQFSDTLKGKTDGVASTLQPQHEKTGTQKLGDAASGSSNNESLAQKAKNALGMGDH